MKKQILPIIPIIFLMIASDSFAKPLQLIFGTSDKEDFPHLIGNAETLAEKNPGVAVEFIRLIEAKAEIPVEIVRRPMKRILEIDLKDGNVDGAFFVSYKQEREQFGVYPMHNGKIDETKAYETASYYFYKLKEAKIQWNGRTLSNVQGKIGVSRGYSVIEDLRNMGLTNFDEAPNPLSDFRKLAIERIQIIAELEMNAAFILKENPDIYDKVEKIAPPIASKSYFLLFSHQFYQKFPETAETIWNLVKEMREQEFEHIYFKYIGD